MPYFSNIGRIAADGSPGAGRPSKTCPDVPNEFRVAACKPRIAANQTSWTGNTHRLAGNVGSPRDARCFKVIEFSCIVQRIYLVL